VLAYVLHQQQASSVDITSRMNGNCCCPSFKTVVETDLYMVEACPQLALPGLYKQLPRTINNKQNV